jgi:hypothetical protein|tara:strand:+ start:457 stop:1209 length:753 start_codon:yes stop_codon:yes gene_type:complete
MSNYTSAIAVVPSNTVLLNGANKVVNTTTSVDNVAMTASVNLVLTTANSAIRPGMILTGTDANGVQIPVNGETGYPVVIERVVDSKNFTLSFPITYTTGTAGTTITYDQFAQSSWGSYNIMIGDVPANPTATTIISNLVANGATLLTWSQPNLYIKTGMNVSGAGIATGTTLVASTSTTATLSIATTVEIPQGTVLSFGYSTISNIKVTTIDNVDVIITNPPQNEIIPLDVAQVWAQSQNVSQITAFKNY